MDRIINDFTINIATANGTGSQSANLILLQSLFDMGVPVSGKNLFPSNISGLPTWYIVRLSDKGYQAPGDRTPNWLDGVHTVFGEVTSGCNHVTAISGVSTGSNDRPTQDVELVSATFVGSETKPWYEFW